MQPLVSSIVLNYRSPQDAVRCVEALLQQTIRAPSPSPSFASLTLPSPPVGGRGKEKESILFSPLPEGEGKGEGGDRLEIIIVDNHSDDESIGMLRARFRAEPVRILESRENMGYAKGNATGAAQAAGTYLLFLNPDNVLPPDALEKMLAIMESDVAIGILGPSLLYPDGTLRPSARQFPGIRELIFKRLAPSHWQRSYEQEIHARSLKLARPDDPVARPCRYGRGREARSFDVDWLVGACLLIRHDLFKELGGFDQRFFLFFEDMDLCRRCHLAGKRVVYAPRIHVRDRRERLSDGGLFSILFKTVGRIHLASGIKYFWKWRNSSIDRPVNCL